MNADDTEFARRFERGEVPNKDFHHREHLRLAWAYLQESATADEACNRMRKAIRGLAESEGHPEKYHETLTVFWVRLLAQVRMHAEAPRDLEGMLESHAHLLDKDAPLAFYSRERLFGGAARIAWQAPDLRPLPSHAPATDPRDPSSDSPYRPLRGRAA